MFKMKKIISLICAAVLSVGVIVVPANAQKAVNMEKINNAATLLKVLNIADTTFDSGSYSETISRADFVLCVAKILNVPGLEGRNDITYYTDVPLDFWALREINLLVEAGALTVPADKIFRPDAPIKKTEAMKIMLSLMKYDTYCKALGGFPSGYTSVAYENEMADNLSAGEYMTYADTLMLIYNSLEVPLMNIDYNGSILYEDETLLSYYYNVYSVEGQVTSAGGMAITGEVAYDGEITINDEKYLLENVNAYEFLGQTVKAYIREDSDEETVIAIEALSRKNEVLEIDTEDVKEVDMSQYTLEYYEDGNKTDTVKLSKGIMVLKNGANVSDSLSSAFSFDKGVIKLIDVNNDGYFDYAFNTVYRNIVVGYINPETMTVYDKISPENKISLENYDDKKVNIFKNGTKSNFSAITMDSVISVIDSEEYVRIDICTENVSGQIFEKDEEDGKTSLRIGITSTESDVYTINPEYLKYEGEKIKIGASGTFYLDAYGRIAYGVMGVDSNFVFAYVKGVRENEDNGNVALSLFEQSGIQHVVQCSSKLRVDGSGVKGVASQKAVLLNSVGQVIRIRKQNDEIVEIDTALPTTEADKAQSFVKTGELTGQRYVYGQKRFGTMSLHSDNTIFMVVPNDINDMSEEMYSIVQRGFFISSKNYDIDTYKLDSSEAFENVIVAKITDTPHIASQTMFLVSDKNTVLGADDEVVTQIEGYYAGAKTSFVAAEALDCSLFDEGDIIMIVSKNTKGEVTNVKLRYDDDAENPAFDYTSDGLNSVSTNVYNNYHYMVGNIIDVTDGVISIGYDDINKVNVKMLESATGTIIVYDKNEKGDNKFQKGSVKNLVPSNYENPNCTRVVAWVKAGVIQWAVAYQPTDK